MNKFHELVDKYLALVWGVLLMGAITLGALYGVLWFGKSIFVLLGVI